jgi:hypothetical protein
MKILICNDGRHAHFFQRVSWANAFRKAGHDVFFWEKQKIPAFDAFDLADPDIFLGQSYNLDEATIKCIKERPHLRVGLRAGDWGDQTKEIDQNKFNILTLTTKEVKMLEELKNETGAPDFVHIHYPEWAVKQTHNNFENIGIKAASLMMCADTTVYGGGQRREELMCDIGFVGGYWPYKGQIIDQYLMPLLHPVGRYNVKIFGNQPWPANQYCGLIQDDKVKDLFVSSKICPNLSEPHAHEFGFDVNERIFKVLYAGGFCITDNVEGYKMFGDGVVVADSPKDFAEKVEYYANTDAGTMDRSEIIQKGQSFVRENHTNYHRCAEIMSLFGYKDEAKKLLEIVDES